MVAANGDVCAVLLGFLLANFTNDACICDVATAVGGLLSLVEDGVNGFLVPDRDVNLFARRVTEVLDDSHLAQRLSSQAVLRSSRYSWQHAAMRMRRVVAEFARRDLVLCE